eukprot:189477-Hanusia_phi.AAC.4
MLAHEIAASSDSSSSFRAGDELYSRCLQELEKFAGGERRRGSVVWEWLAVRCVKQSNSAEVRRRSMQTLKKVVGELEKSEKAGRKEEEEEENYKTKVASALLSSSQHVDDNAVLLVEILSAVSILHARNGSASSTSSEGKRKKAKVSGQGSKEGEEEERQEMEGLMDSIVLLLFRLHPHQTVVVEQLLEYCQWSRSRARKSVLLLDKCLSKLSLNLMSSDGRQDRA